MSAGPVESRREESSMAIQALFLVLMSLASGPVVAAEVSREDWVEGMQATIPTLFCQRDQYFRQCFRVDAIECETLAASSVRNCLASLGESLPAVLQQPRDGTHWGSRVGQCAGTAYELALMDKRLSNPRCDDVNNWR